ncbi:MAG: UDP-2,3-diacylglucosamine diphosphatase LpxI [Pseudomonadota bacterium]
MTLALIAGQGGLPPHLVDVLRARGEVPLICETEQHPSDVTALVPRLRFRLEELGTLLELLRDMGVGRLCMAGAMRRPPVDPARIDAATLPLVPRVQAALAQGDDATLRAFVAIFEEAGLHVVGAAELDPALLPGAGVQAAVPADDVEAEIALATAALDDMAKADLGQAVVVCATRVIAREQDSGTDAMLAGLIPDRDAGPEVTADPLGAVGHMLDNVADWLGGPAAEAARRTLPAQGGLLYKAPKPGQELRVDMPVIGPDTVMHAAAAGLRGIVIEQGGVMVMDAKRVHDMLDRAGLFLLVRPRTTG